MKQTAVEWLIDKMKTYNMTVSVHNTSHENVMDFYKTIEEAKEMEKQQMNKVAEVWWNEGASYMYDGKREFESFEQYYNETFKSE
jgi:sulfatase maturation enzyme AslB (radical SAM superfamily)